MKILSAKQISELEQNEFDKIYVKKLKKWKNLAIEKNIAAKRNPVC